MTAKLLLAAAQAARVLRRYPLAGRLDVIAQNLLDEQRRRAARRDARAGR